MAEDRVAEDVALIRQFRQRVASCAKMCCIGVSGIGTPAILPISGPQMPAAETTISVAIRPCGVTTARTRPLATSMPVTGVCAWKVAPRSAAAAARPLRDRRRVDHAVAGDEERAVQVVRAENRDHPARLVRADQARVQPPRHRLPDAPLQLLPPLRRRGDLHAAGAPERPLRRRDLAVQFRAPHRQLGDALGDVVLEHHPRRVRGRAPVLPERPLLQHDDVAPAHPRQFIRRAAPDDPRADNDHPARASASRVPFRATSCVPARRRAAERRGKETNATAPAPLRQHDTRRGDEESSTANLPSMRIQRIPGRR